jgi:hypothetical protein
MTAKTGELCLNKTMATTMEGRTLCARADSVCPSKGSANDPAKSTKGENE